MAGKFMKIKRIVIPFMTLVVMTSQLAGCATMSSDEMLKTMQESPEVSIEYATPDEGEQTMDASKTITVGDQQFVSDSTTDSNNAGSKTTDTEDEQDIGMIEQQQEVTELSGAALEEYFQLAYDSGTSLEGGLETRISGELDILNSLVNADDSVKLPGGYADQYRAWRPAEEVDPFTEVNETVYATGTVNIRASYTADSDKLGSLSVGQSVTRTGTSIAGTEAEGWSRVELSDGSTAYVSNKYLSTTKPVAQQPSGGSTQGKPSGQTQQPETSQQPITPQQSADSSGLTPEEQAIRDKFLKDNEEAKANGWSVGEGDPLTDEDIEGIGSILYGG